MREYRAQRKEPYILAKELYILAERGTHTPLTRVRLMRDSSQGRVSLTCATRYVLAKEPYVLSKEPYILAKEPYILAKEPYVLAKEPYILAKGPYILAKEPYILAKEPYILAKEPYILAKEPYVPHAATRALQFREERHSHGTHKNAAYMHAYLHVHIRIT